MNLSEYIASNKQEILRRVETGTRPLLTNEEPTPVFESLRKPYDAQARVIEASRRALSMQKACFVIGEMGTGKTLMGSLIPEDGSKILILCPSHLQEKWVREIHETRPNSVAVIIKSLQDCDRLIRELPTGKQTLWYVLSKETAKLSYLWRNACKIKKEQRWIYDRMSKEQILSEINTCLCPDCFSYITRTDSKGNEFFIGPDTLERNRMFCPKCKAALWTADNKRNRKYALADYLKKRHARIDYLIIDEAHEYKAQDSAQGNSLGSLASISENKILLTGTLIGGYATHLYYLLWRVLPNQMKARGYTYSNTKSFIAQYGVREQITRDYQGDGSSNKRSKGATNKGSWQERPGISPELFTDFLLGNGLYLQLDDLAADLPPLEEKPISVEMSPDQEIAYKVLESELKHAVAQDLARGNKRMLSKLLINLLAFPDKPFDNTCIELEQGQFVQVPNLDSRQTFPKEEKLVEIALDAKARGSKTLVYCQFTSSRDIQPRLQETLQAAGLNVAVLRSTVKPEKREQWIKDNAPDNDCLICNPEIVKTGLDLYAYTTIVFFQTGYNIFTLRQASRRSWRLGQTQPCNVFYLYYADTMQSRAIELIARKTNSATALDGRLSNEGLNQLADEDDAFILAKALVEGLKTDKPVFVQAQVKPQEQAEQDNVDPRSMDQDQQAGMIVEILGKAQDPVSRLWLQTSTGIPVATFAKLINRLESDGTIEQLNDRRLRLKRHNDQAVIVPMTETLQEQADHNEQSITENQAPEIINPDRNSDLTIGDVKVLLIDVALTAEYIAQTLNQDMEKIYEILIQAQKKAEIFSARTPGSIYWCSARNFGKLEYAETRVLRYLRENGHSAYPEIVDAITSHSLREPDLQKALINLKASNRIQADLLETSYSGNGLLRSIFWISEPDEDKDGLQAVTEIEDQPEKETSDVRAMRKKIETTKYNITLFLQNAAMAIDAITKRYSDQYKTEGIHRMLSDLEEDGKIMRHKDYILLTEHFVEEPLIEDIKASESMAPVKQEVVKDLEYYRKLRDSRQASKKTRRNSRQLSTPQLTLFG